MENIFVVRLRYRYYRKIAFKKLGFFISKAIKSFIHYSIGANEKEA